MAKDIQPGTPRIEIAVLRAEQAELRADRAELRTAEAMLRIKDLEADLTRARDDNLAKQRYTRYQLWSRGINGATYAAIVAVAYFPLTAAEGVITRLIASPTAIRTDTYISIAFALAVVVVLGVVGVQSRLRKRKIKSQRERLERLERELDDLRRNRG
ncbi:hypothetical protein O7627_30425 [Solwaraspora sp. WMMD1047]|uniref:hypothetical protein n=1 Tax=Solwaraspora sp. WMMD1047 TaxID=3016102 RepID=UPI0024167E5F|nr:hypothetical protein [Solwaraspora sp. WMMD1047]MDG4833592.1 hypothetical protein [Solwaraspora sp. WMMD1047]